LFKIIKKAIQNGSIYAVGNIINRGIPFLLMPYLTRVLPPSEYGLISLFLSLSVLLTATIGFSSNSVISQRYFKVDDSEHKYLITDALKLSFLGFIILSIILIPFAKIIRETFNIPIWLLYLTIVISFFNIWFLIAKLILQIKNNAVIYSIVVNLVTVINLIGSIFFISVLHLSWKGRVYGFVISSLISFIFSLTILKKYQLITKFSILETRYIKNIFFLGIALTPTSIGGWLVSMGDRFILSGMLSNDAVGIYAAAFSLASLLDIVATPVGLIWAPKFFEKKSENILITDKTVNNITLILSSLYIIIAALGSILIPFFTKIFLGEQYYNSVTLVPWLIFGLAFRSIGGLLSYYILHNEKNIFLTYNFIITSSITIGLSLVMIRSNGVSGLAQANFISGILSVLIILIFLIISERKKVCNGN